MLRPPSTIVRGLLAATLLPLAAVGLAGCGDAAGPDRADLPDKEVFVATYVDLRAAALGAERGELTDELRSAVLAQHAVTEEQLYAFVDHYGENLPFMRDVWNEVEAGLEARRSPGAAVPGEAPEPGRN